MIEVKLNLREKFKLWLFGFVTICDERNNDETDVKRNVVNVCWVIRHPGPPDFWYEEERCRKHNVALDIDGKPFRRCPECMRETDGGFPKGVVDSLFNLGPSQKLSDTALGKEILREGYDHKMHDDIVKGLKIPAEYCRYPFEDEGEDA